MLCSHDLVHVASWEMQILSLLLIKAYQHVQVYDCQSCCAQLACAPWTSLPPFSTSFQDDVCITILIDQSSKLCLHYTFNLCGLTSLQAKGQLTIFVLQRLEAFMGCSMYTAFDHKSYAPLLTMPPTLLRTCFIFSFSAHSLCIPSWSGVSMPFPVLILPPCMSFILICSNCAHIQQTVLQFNWGEKSGSSFSV